MLRPAIDDADPHAVTDITGFGLAGHVAEMAEASGCAVEIDLAALSAMPGALEAAATGLVPVGAGKNRTSIAAVLAVGAVPAVVIARRRERSAAL